MLKHLVDVAGKYTSMLLLNKMSFINIFYSNVIINIMSIYNFIFRGTGHRGVGKILRGNSDFSSYDQWGWTSGDIQSVKRCPRCNNCRI